MASRYEQDPLGLYDNSQGEIPPVAIGELSYAHPNGNKRSPEEINEAVEAARAVGANVTTKPLAEKDTTVIHHPKWLWVAGGVVGAAVTGIGIATPFLLRLLQERKRR